MNGLVQDMRYGARILAKSPGFTVVAVLSLAIGIGVTTIVFSVMGTLFLRPYGLPDESKVVRVTGKALTADASRRMRESVRSVMDLAQYQIQRTFVKTEDGKEPINAEVVSGDYFATLGLKPAVGRLFEEGDALVGAEQSCVISHDLWRRRFAGSPGVIGKRVDAAAGRLAVEGVAPSGFQGMHFGTSIDLWRMVDPAARHDFVGSQPWSLVGRLRAGATEEQARVALRVGARDLGVSEPGVGGPARFRLQSLAREARFRKAPVVFFTAVAGLVLLVACANVAGLLAARAEKRRAEIVVRMALGSSRGRLVRQLLTESALLALAGAATGLLLTRWLSTIAMTQIMQMSLFSSHPEVRLDLRVLVFTLLLAMTATLVSGLLPALRASSVDLSPALKSEQVLLGGGRRRVRLRHAFVTAQLLVTFVFIATAGLFVRANTLGLSSGQGWPTGRVLQARLLVNATDADSARETWNEVVDRMRALPGVVDVSLSSSSPILRGMTRKVSTFDRRDPSGRRSADAGVRYVQPSYFGMTGALLVSGRLFTEKDDRLDAKVAVISEQTARRFWPQAEPLGRMMQVGESLEETREIVGVVRDAMVLDDTKRMGEMTTDRNPAVYLPHSALDDSSRLLLMRIRGDARSMTSAVRQSLARVRGLERVDSLQSQRQWSPPEIQAQTALGFKFLGTLGLLAALLAMVGLYASLSHFVDHRTPEIGVRMALGAQRADVLKLIMRQGAWLALAGVALGLPAAIAAERLARSGFFGVPATNCVILSGTAIAVFVAAMIASFVPARRAASVDPLAALRHE